MDKNKRDSFIRHLKFAEARHSFKDCPYYPCHEMAEGEALDCTFCFCPFYPCGGGLGNGKWIYDKMSGRIWDCSLCDFIHRSGVFRRITELLYENRDFKEIKKIISREFHSR